MVECYCGCDTRANRIKFAVSGVLYVVGIALIMLMTPFTIHCFRKIDWGTLRHPHIISSTAAFTACATAGKRSWLQLNTVRYNSVGLRCVSLPGPKVHATAKQVSLAECSIIEINGDDEDYAKYGCEKADMKRAECISSGTMEYALLVLLGEVLLILATIPLCILCCCTRKPREV
jgi:hypothetical protein